MLQNEYREICGQITAHNNVIRELLNEQKRKPQMFKIKILNEEQNAQETEIRLTSELRSLIGKIISAFQAQVIMQRDKKLVLEITFNTITEQKK